MWGAKLQGYLGVVYVLSCKCLHI